MMTRSILFAGKASFLDEWFLPINTASNTFNNIDLMNISLKNFSLKDSGLIAHHYH